MIRDTRLSVFKKRLSTSQEEISVSSCKVTLPTPNAECMHGGGGAVRPSHAVECQDKLLRPIFRHSAAGATDSLGDQRVACPSADAISSYSKT